MRLIDMNQRVCPPLLGAIISCSAQPHSAVMIIIIMSTNGESRGNSIQLRPQILNSTEKLNKMNETVEYLELGSSKTILLHILKKYASDFWVV